MAASLKSLGVTRFNSYHSPIAKLPCFSACGEKIYKYRLRKADGTWYESEVNVHARAQSYADMCSITKIIERMTVDPESIRERRAEYGDVSNNPEDVLEFLSQKEMEVYDRERTGGSTIQSQGASIGATGKVALQQAGQVGSENSGQAGSEARGSEVEHSSNGGGV